MRREWVLRRLSETGKLRVSNLTDRFDCSRTTARRDLADLRRLGRIEFVGPPRTGHWQLRRA